jgi:ribosomal protein S27E
MATDEQKRNNVKAMENMFTFISSPSAQPGKGVREIPPEGVSFIFDAKLTTGEWYFTISCPHCQHDTPLFRDPSAGKFANPWKSDNPMRVNCLSCQKEVAAPAYSMHSVQWT